MVLSSQWMSEKMRKRIFTIVAIGLALIFWFFDSTVHYFIYGEPEFELIPSDFNELWMRIVIISLILLFGIFADYFTHQIMYKQKQLEVAHIYGSLIHASRDVLDNLLIQMRLFKIEANKSQDFDPNIIGYFDNAIQQLSELVATLSKVEQALKDPESLVGSNQRRSVNAK